MNMRKLLLRTVIAIVISVNLNACGKNLPDPVERKDGYAWIPIADTAFLIPEKTWLKSYGRKSTDGSVDSFDLHVTAPDVQPWSEAVNEQMYPPAGPGQRIDVVVKDDRELLAFQFERFYVPPQSRWGESFPLQEVPSELASNGLRKFRDSSSKNTVFHERIENGRVKYFIYCDDGDRDVFHQDCHLSFPWGKTIYVNLSFTRNYLPYSVSIADQIAERLKEFEAAARAYQKQPASN